MATQLKYLIIGAMTLNGLCVGLKTVDRVNMTIVQGPSNEKEERTQDVVKNYGKRCK